MNGAELKQVEEYFKALSGLEDAIGDYYSLCGGLWPEEGIWKLLAAEEKRHGETVLAMLDSVKAAPGRFKLGKPLNLKALELFKDGIKVNAGKVASGVFNAKNALAIGVDMERSLMESCYDRILETGDQYYRIATDGFKEDNSRHARILAERLAALGVTSHGV